MRKTAISLVAMLVGLASIVRLDAANLAGVTLPDTVNVGSRRLVLNGLGLRTKFVVKVSKNQMADAFQESCRDNAPEASQKLKAEIDRLLAALEPLKEQDEMVFTYLPGTGTTLAIKGQDKLTIAGPEFGQLLFAVWLGPKPPNSGLKKGLLGQ